MTIADDSWEAAILYETYTWNGIECRNIFTTYNTNHHNMTMLCPYFIKEVRAYLIFEKLKFINFTM